MMLGALPAQNKAFLNVSFFLFGERRGIIYYVERVITLGTYPYG